MKTVGIVVSYNSTADLPMSLGSLRRLPVSRFVVVDNSSTDGSVQMALDYTPDVLTSPNVGFGKAINLAVRHAPDADAYLLLNPDCGITPDNYEALHKALEDNDRLGVVAPTMRYPDGRYGISAGPEMSIAKEWLAALHVDALVPRGMRATLSRSKALQRAVPMLRYLQTGPVAGLREVAWVSGFCMLIRAEAFHSIGGFDPSFFLYFEDVDLCKRLRERGWGVASVGDSVADHRESTSTSTVGKRRLYRDGMVVYFGKHGTKTDKRLARALRRFPI
jgi:N-acetylglucosaminyl-diphospho-decaprenol L-rhamnosyltransferase